MVRRPLVEGIVIPVLQALTGRCFLQEMEHLREWSIRPPGERAEISHQRLRRTASLALGAPFYRERRTAGASVADFPVVDRRDLQEAGPRALAVPGVNQKDLFEAATSGTTATPIKFLHSRRLGDAATASLWFYLSWFDVRPGDAVLFAWHNVGSYRAQRRARRLLQRLLNIRYLPTRLVVEQDGSALWQRLESIRPACIVGYPSLLQPMNEALRVHGRKLSFVPRVVVYSAEHMDERARDYVRDTFDCPVVGRYGCGEFQAIVAHQCPAVDAYHINDWGYMLETVPAEGFPEEGFGRLVVTDLYNRHAPLIRYATGDLASLGAECACGYRGPVIKKIIGREAECVVMPDGRRVSARLLIGALKASGAYDRGQTFQFLQTGPEEFEVHYVPRGEFPPTVYDRMVVEFEGLLGGQLRVRGVARDSISPEPSGKRPILKKVGNGGADGGS